MSQKIDLINGDTISSSSIDGETPDRIFRRAWKLNGTSVEIDATIKAEILRSKVNAERDRRITAGCEFGGHFFQTDERSLRRISDVSKEALGAIVNGAQANDFRWHGGETDFTFAAADNTAVPMDAPSMWAFGLAVGKREKVLIDKARALKDRPGGPPDNYDADEYWT